MPTRQKPTDDQANKIIAFIDFLEEAALSYVKYLKRNHVTDKKEQYWLEQISCHPADASIMPLILSILSCNGISQDNKNVLLELLEKLNFRYYVTGIANRADTGQGHLFCLAHQFFNHFGEEDGKTINDLWLQEESIKFIDRHASDIMFIESPTLDKDDPRDYAYWPGLKFFLASYEQNLLEKANRKGNLPHLMAPESKDKRERDSFCHKEHFWAIAENQYDDPENLDVNKRRLGNFMLLNQGWNKAVKNKKPKEKFDCFKYPHKTSPDTLMIQKASDTK